MRRSRVQISGRWPLMFRFVTLLSLAGCGVHGYQAGDQEADVVPTSQASDVMPAR